MNFKSLLPFLAVAVLTFSSTRAAAPVIVPHVADDKKTAVTIRTTEEVKIMLPPPAAAAASPGYEWQIISNDSRILRLTRSPKPVAAEKAPAPGKSAAPAAPGAWSASFVGLRPGRSVVRFVYVRATTSGEETTTDSREIVVTVRQ